MPNIRWWYEEEFLKVKWGLGRREEKRGNKIRRRADRRQREIERDRENVSAWLWHLPI